METPFRCPLCGAPLELDPDCVVDEPFATPYPRRDQPTPRRQRVAAVALCTGCEFAVEVRP